MKSTISHLISQLPASSLRGPQLHRQIRGLHALNASQAQLCRGGQLLKQPGEAMEAPKVGPEALIFHPFLQLEAWFFLGGNLEAWFLGDVLGENTWTFGIGYGVFFWRCDIIIFRNVEEVTYENWRARLPNAGLRCNSSMLSSPCIKFISPKSFNYATFPSENKHQKNITALKKEKTHKHWVNSKLSSSKVCKDMLTVFQARPSFLRVCQLFLRCSAQPTLRHHELHVLPGCAEIGAWQATNELETMETIPPPKKWPKYDSTRLKCQNDSKWEQDINISHISHIYNNENIFKTSLKKTI